MMVKTSRIVRVMVLVSSMAGVVSAEDPAAKITEEQAQMEAWVKAMTPGPQHAALADMAGEFTTTVTMYAEPGAEPEVSKGTASRRMIMGGRYLEEDFHSTFMDQPFEGRGHTGYDNVSGQWWGSWFDNMSTGLLTSYGNWDLDSGIGTFHGEYVDPATGRIVPTRTVVQLLEGGDERMEMYMLTDTGEFKSMVILYERK